MQRLTIAALFAFLLGLLAVTTAQAKGGHDCSGGGAHAAHCDLDGDGVANKDDPDIDGDGIANEEDTLVPPVPVDPTTLARRFQRTRPHWSRRCPTRPH